MSEPSQDTRRALLPRPLATGLLIILVGALIGGYVFGLRGRAPEPADRPANKAPVTLTDLVSSAAFHVHQAYRGAFERGETGPRELESWLGLLQRLSHLPEWQVAYMRILIENSRIDETLDLSRQALSEGAYLAAADAALINGEPERLVLWRDEVSDEVELPSFAVDQVASPRYRAIERTLLGVSAALEANDEQEAYRLARRAVGEGSALVMERAALYDLLERCPGRPEYFVPAVEVLRRSAENDPSNALEQALLTRLLLVKAIAHLALMQPEEAATALSEVPPSGFDRAEVLYYQTVVLEMQGDLEAAAAVALQGVDELAYVFEYVHARVLLKLGRVGEAYDAITRWREITAGLENPGAYVGESAYHAAEQLSQLLTELNACGELGSDGETQERGLMLGSDRFRCEFLSEAAPFRRWFATAFEAPQTRSDEDLSLALLSLWTQPPEERDHLLARRSSHFLGVHREMIRAHLRFLDAVRAGDDDLSRARWQHLERLRAMLLSQ